jgi:hypothetical protein
MLVRFPFQFSLRMDFLKECNKGGGNIHRVDAPSNVGETHLKCRVNEIISSAFFGSKRMQ